MRREAEIGLLILRLGLGVFLLLFGVDKLVAPRATAAVFAHYYGLGEASATVIYAAGVAETALALAMLAGLWKTLSYGLGLLVHAVSTLATWRELLAPFGENHLYLAALPVLAAFVALFLLRRDDTLLSLDARRAGETH